MFYRLDALPIIKTTVSKHCHNHTSHSRQEMTRDIRRHRRVRTVPGKEQRCCLQLWSSDKIHVPVTLLCHVKLCYVKTDTVGCEEQSQTAGDRPLISHAADEYAAYRPALHSPSQSAAAAAANAFQQNCFMQLQAGVSHQ